jgi:hypothetical protein
MADNVVFYKGPRHGQSVCIADLSITAINLPIPTGRMVLNSDGRAQPEFGVAVYRKTPYSLSGGRRIFKFER